MGTQTTLTLKNYGVSYGTDKGPLKVLDAINLHIGKGEVLGLVGESGSGKSTLALAIMRALRGRVAHETGQILLGDVALHSLQGPALNRIRGKRIAMVFQDPGGSLNPTLTLGEHFRQTLARHRQLNPSEIRQETDRLLKMVDLPDTQTMALKYPHEVSGGEKQRAVIALAFACDPELILFDEPTSALDATTAVTILDLFRDLQKRTGVSALFISHDLGVVREIAHRVAVIYAGRIAEVAENRQLFAQPRHPYTRSLLASLPKAATDGEQTPLISIPGSLPDRTVAIPGCNFAERCQFATDPCRRGPIELAQDFGHAVACPYWQTVLYQAIGSDENSQMGVRLEISEPPLLSLNNLSVHISRPDLFARLMGRQPKVIHAVNDVDLDLHGGETLGLVGESGCGKSSLAKALVGLRPFLGHLELDGQPIPSVAQMDSSYRQKVQIIFQNPDLSLNPRQSIGTILSRPLKLYPGQDTGAMDDKINRLLQRVNLPPEFATRYPHELSGGEKQRVAIARALAAKPDLIICDEITSGLDASVQASIVNLLRDVQRATGVAYLFITHDLNLLRHIADRVAVMYLGEIVEIRPAHKIGLPPYQPYTEALLSSAPVLDPGLEPRRIRLQGAPASRLGAAKGCPFESRCPRRIDDICLSERPPRIHFDRGHWIQCHLDQRSLRSVPPIWTATPTSLNND